MKIPYRNNVVIPREKLTDYLLSETHTVGKLKAKFFHEIGFNENTADELEQILRTIVQKCDVKETIISPYGKKYIIDGFVQSKTGRTVELRTVWIIERSQKQPRFVTAYPV